MIKAEDIYKVTNNGLDIIIRKPGIVSEPTAISNAGRQKTTRRPVSNCSVRKVPSRFIR